MTTASRDTTTEIIFFIAAAPVLLLGYKKDNGGYPNIAEFLLKFTHDTGGSHDNFLSVVSTLEMLNIIESANYSYGDIVLTDNGINVAKKTNMAVEINELTKD